MDAPRRQGGAASWRLAAAVGALSLAPLSAPADGRYGPLELRPKDSELIEKCSEIDELLRRRGRVVDEGPAADLVRRVGAAVAPSSPADPYVDFRFALLRHPVPNAFALPDGRIYVHEGLLALLENEAQLASVLAHEAMHVEGHHSIVHSRQARKKMGGLLAFRLLLGAASPEIGSLASLLADQLVSTLVLQAVIGYGRELEEEADRGALSRMLEAGYDPHEMPRTFELLAQDPEGERPDPKPKWSSHPLAVQRAATMRGLLEERRDELGSEGLRTGQEQFEAVVHEASRRTVREYLDADRPRTALWLSRRNVERWPEDPQFHSQLGDSWRSLDARVPEWPEDSLSRRDKRRRARDRLESTRRERLAERLDSPQAEERHLANLTSAEGAYREALRLEPEHPAALRGMALLEEDRGRDLEAGRWLARYLRAAPEAPDHAIQLRRLERLTERLRTEGVEGG